MTKKKHIIEIECLVCKALYMPARGSKFCTECRKDYKKCRIALGLTIDGTSYDHTSPEAKAKRKEYHEKNKEAARAYYQANKEKYTANRRAKALLEGKVIKPRIFKFKQGRPKKTEVKPVVQKREYRTEGKEGYVSNKELYCEMLVSLARGRLTNRAAEIFMLIGKGVQKKMYYNNLLDKEDCYMGGLSDMLTHWYNYNPETTANPFAYFTEVFKRGSAKAWNGLHPKGVQFLSLDYTNEEGDKMWDI